MITGLVLLAIIALAVVASGPSRTGPLTRGERSFMLISGLPAFLALILPAPIGMFTGATDSVRALTSLLSRGGLWLSVGLIPVGAALLWRRRSRTGGIDARLGAALVMAALPFLLVLLVGLLWWAR